MKNISELLKKYPDHVPVIINRNPADKILRDIDKKNYLIPKNLKVSEIYLIIRKKITIDSKHAIFIFVKSHLGDVLVPVGSNVLEIYDLYKNDDGILYIIYTTENTFG